MGKYKKSKKGVEKTPEGECPIKAHNSPDWYTRELVPQIGANYSVLTTVNPETRITSGTTGMYVNTILQHGVAVTVPIDAASSFHYKMSELYAEIREVNAGASNYNPVILGAYISKILAMRALCAHVRRGLAAVRYGNGLYRESPAVFVAAAGFHDFAAEAAAYAQNFNDFALLCKDIEALPVPPMAIMDRYEFILDKVFADSQTTRPALISFIPESVHYFNATYVEETEEWVYTDTRIYNQPSTSTLAKIATVISNIRTLFNAVINDSVVAVLRGDLLKAFGSACIRRNLVSSVDMPFSIGYSPDVMSQLENATLMAGSSTGVVTVDMSTQGGPATLTIPYASAYAYLALNMPNRIINYHGDQAPQGATLMSITRLVATGKAVGSNIVVESTSGITIINSKFVGISTANKSTSVLNIGTAIANTHSTTQSTAEDAYKGLMTLCTLVDHMPMIVHHANDVFGIMFDVDNAAYMASETLQDLTELANRSLVDAHIPRGSNGRFLR